MKKFARRAAIAVATLVTTVGLVSMSAPPAQAGMDTGWGCGGACRTIR
jgi:hypothetical protein